MILISLISLISSNLYCIYVSRGRKGIVADAGIVADNDISRTIIVIKK